MDAQEFLTVQPMTNFFCNITLYAIFIVESYTNSKTVEQKVMFTIYKVLSKTHVHTLQQFDCQIVAKCEHEFYSTLYKV